MPESTKSSGRRPRRTAAAAPTGPIVSSRYEDLVHDLEAVIWEADAETLEFTFISRRVEQILGWPADEWLRRSEKWPNHVIAQDREAALAECRLAPAEGRGHQIEYRALTADGRIVWLRDRIRRVHTGDASERLRGVMLDITQRKEAELALQRERNFVHAILETVGALVVVLDRDGRIVEFNRACERATGYTFAEVRGVPFWELLLTPEEEAAVQDVFRDLVAGDFPSEHENYWIAKDGKKRLIAWTNTVLLDESGRVEYVVAAGLDITDRNRAERTLGIRARQQAAVADLGQAALAGADLTGILKEAVRKVAEILQVEYCTVMELLPERESFVVTAGVGWRPGLEGLACVSALPDTMAGFTLKMDEPVVSEDLREEKRFRLTPLFAEHGVISGMAVVVRTRLQPFGVLGVHSRRRRAYSQDDVNFLQAVANVLGTAIERMETEQVSRDQTSALTRTLDALASRQELDVFLGQVLTAIAEQLGAGTVALWMYDAAESTIVVSMYYDHGAIVREKRFGKPSGSGPFRTAETPLWLEMVERGRALFVPDLATDMRSRSREWLLARGMHSMLMVPLLLGDEPIGCFTIGSKDAHGYRPEEVELAQALAQQATLALQLTRLADESKQSAVLQERNRMAREIHDTLAQGFTGILVQLEAAEDAAGELSDASLAHIARAKDLARASLAEARRSVWSLRLHVLEGYDLPGAFTRLVGQMTSGTSVQAKFRVRGTPRSLPPESEGHLLRIGLEALTNALKHADARLVRLELGFQPEQVRLSIRDDGRGFDPDSHMKDGFGLSGMRERAEFLHGELTIVSRPGEGTEVVLLAPDPPPVEAAS